MEEDNKVRKYPNRHPEKFFMDLVRILYFLLGIGALGVLGYNLVKGLI